MRLDRQGVSLDECFYLFYLCGWLISCRHRREMKSSALNAEISDLLRSAIGHKQGLGNKVNVLGDQGEISHQTLDSFLQGVPDSEEGVLF